MIILKQENPYIPNGLIEYLGHRSCNVAIV